MGGYPSFVLSEFDGVWGTFIKLSDYEYGGVVGDFHFFLLLMYGFNMLVSTISSNNYLSRQSVGNVKCKNFDMTTGLDKQINDAANV